MARMIDDLYDLTRVRMSGGIPLQPRPDVDVGEIAERVVSELGPAYPGRAVRVERLGDTRGVWDHDRLGQVLSNLVGNALRHGSSDTPVQLRIDGTAAHEVVITVQNGGVIPKELLPHLFEPFRRGPGAQRDGLGLGLFIVQHLVRAHGGDIDVTTSGDRTCVRVRLSRGPRCAAAKG